jgi:hypothetical protein
MKSLAQTSLGPPTFYRPCRKRQAGLRSANEARPLSALRFRLLSPELYTNRDTILAFKAVGTDQTLASASTHGLQIDIA